VEHFDTVFGKSPMRGTNLAQLERDVSCFLHFRFPDLIDEFAETLKLCGLTYRAFCGKKSGSSLAHFLQYSNCKILSGKIAITCNGLSKIRGGGMIA
jgi:hypothetical protein